MARREAGAGFTADVRLLEARHDIEGRAAFEAGQPGEARGLFREALLGRRRRSAGQAAARRLGYADQLAGAAREQSITTVRTVLRLGEARVRAETRPRIASLRLAQEVRDPQAFVRREGGAFGLASLPRATAVLGDACTRTCTPRAHLVGGQRERRCVASIRHAIAIAIGLGLCAGQHAAHAGGLRFPARRAACLIAAACIFCQQLGGRRGAVVRIPLVDEAVAVRVCELALERVDAAVAIEIPRRVRIRPDLVAVGNAVAIRVRGGAVGPERGLAGVVEPVTVFVGGRVDTDGGEAEPALAVGVLGAVLPVGARRVVATARGHEAEHTEGGEEPAGRPIVHERAGHRGLLARAWVAARPGGASPPATLRRCSTRCPETRGIANRPAAPRDAVVTRAQHLRDPVRVCSRMAPPC